MATRANTHAARKRAHSLTPDAAPADGEGRHFLTSPEDVGSFVRKITEDEKLASHDLHLLINITGDAKGEIEPEEPKPE